MDNNNDKKTRKDLYRLDSEYNKLSQNPPVEKDSGSYNQFLNNENTDLANPQQNLKTRSEIAAQNSAINNNQPLPLPAVVPTPIKYKKSHRLRNILLSILGFLLAGTLIFAGYLYVNVKSTADNTYDGLNMASARNVSSVLKQGKPVTILLLGTDTGALGRNDEGRTDTIMIATINPKNNKTTLVSIPRDSMVSVVGYENTFPQKLNDAYAFGSTEATIKTIQDWLNIPIDFYSLVNMGALEKIVDKVGGIEVTSPLTFTYRPDDNQTDVYKFYEDQSYYDYAPNGTDFTRYTQMDGKAALAFSRMRYDDPEGDYGRTQRQRLIITTLLNKTAKIDSIVNRSFLKSISDNIKTNLTFDDMLTLVSNYRNAAKNIETDSLVGNTYEYPDAEGNRVAYELIEDDERQRITNEIRSALGLSKEETGNRFGGTITNGIQIPNPNPNIKEDSSSSSSLQSSVSNQ